MCPENPLAKTFDSLYYKEKYGEYLHSVICLKQENGYYAVVSFYGFITGVLVKLTDNLNVRPVTVMNGFFCDWENGKEYDMINFILGLDSNEGECHKTLCCKEKRKI